MSISTRNVLQQKNSNVKSELTSKAVRSDSLYNLKDFLPNTSTIKTQLRPKINSTFTSAQIDKKQTIPSITNIQQKMIQQKINKLKQQNIQLQQSLQQQRTLNQKQSEEITLLKQTLQSIKLNKQKKHKQISLWSYKYQFEYIPKEKHKYSLAVQTEDIFTSKSQASGSLKAKDFEDIYRRLNINSNPSIVQMGNNKLNKDSNSLKSTLNFTSQIVSGIHQNVSTVRVNKTNESKKSLFKMPKLQDFMQKENKQNMMNYSNINFTKNPMQINIAKIRGDQRPIKQQNFEIYPVEEQYLDAIVGQLLCGDDQ